jgi:hypothetical protein
MLETIISELLPIISEAIISFALKVMRVARILWSMIKDWLKERIPIIRAELANLAFSIKKVLENGGNREYEIIEGIFNKNTGTLVNAQESQDLQSPEIDEETAKQHRNSPLVIFD